MDGGKAWRYFPLVLVALVLLALLVMVGSNTDSVDVAYESTPVPAFKARLLDNMNNKVITDQHLLSGQLTLLNVWASWCGVCRNEHDFLMTLAAREDVQIIGLNYRDQAKQASAMLASAGNPYQAVLYDPDGKVALEFGVYGTPESYLIDRHGVIRTRYQGPLDNTVWQQRFVPIMEQLVSPQSGVGQGEH